MFRNLFVAALAVILTSCMDPPNEWKSHKYDLKAIPGFEDCVMTRIDTGDGRIFAIRCPLSSTTTEHIDGKIHRSTTVVDGTSTNPTESVAADRKETLQCDEAPRSPGVLICTKQLTGE